VITLPKLGESEISLFKADGFLITDRILDPALLPELLPALHHAFEQLFQGRFSTGIRPDEVNWQYDSGDPSLTRQICNGWKADNAIARVVLDPALGEAVATLAGWPGARIMIDNVLWKPPGAKSLGYHQDSAFLDWLSPSDLMTCWIALDETTEAGGTMELVRGSHRWSLSEPVGEFHAPQNYKRPMLEACKRFGGTPEVVPVEVPAGGGSFHHGHCWHGSGPNHSSDPRRSLVLHAMRSDAKLVPENFDQGIGPIYSRYRQIGNNSLDENHFPIIWRNDGYRTPGLATLLARD